MRYLLAAVLIVAVCAVAVAQVPVKDTTDNPAIVCPECGSEPVLVFRKHGRLVQVKCPDCGQRTGEWARCVDQAVDEWNAQISSGPVGD